MTREPASPAESSSAPDTVALAKVVARQRAEMDRLRDQAAQSAVVEQAKASDGINAVCLTTGATWESANALYNRTGFDRVPERDWFVPGTDIKLFVYRLELSRT